MRPPRSILLLLCFVAFPLFLISTSVLYTHPRQATRNVATSPKSGVRAFFSFHTPASLFPPSAIISLTDDNSTFFLARPAAFGPLLPADGLSGQLWVGSGFGDDNLGRGLLDFRAEGELGCSDVPGWGDGQSKYHTEKAGDRASKRPSQQQANSATGQNGIAGKERRALEKDEAKALQQDEPEVTVPDEEDGTDDHLHHPLPDSQIAKQTKPGQSAVHDGAKDGTSQEHADIQSLQESAEISGKVVILSRGGCGFLEKVKWTQRRGGVALIVGDHTRGGNLLTMYAHGDTSNVTIPSLFTSYTTAHLLSSLIPLGRIREPANADGDETPGKEGAKKGKNQISGPTFSTTLELPRATGTSQPTIRPSQRKTLAMKNGKPIASESDSKGWFRSLFGLASRSSSDSDLPANSRRPPTSGHVNWIQSDNWNDEPAKEASTAQKTAKKATKPDAKLKTATDVDSGSGDNFVIGVQDWRDPDLVSPPNSKPATTHGKASTKTSTSKPHAQSSDGKTSASSKANDGNTLKGGSITPGSGEYRKPGHASLASLAAQQKLKYLSAEKQRAREGQGWLSRLFWGSDDYEDDEVFDLPDQRPSKFIEELDFEGENGEELNGNEEHEGLWVTLTPTTISTSPFFDTLLVLVVSPLITLTVVYALLLLRSRIRRRRWRAPKSVVDRLPVRTYHTMSCGSSSSTSSQIATPHTTDPSAPLLQHSPSSQRSGISRTRPRSRTTSGIGELAALSLEQVTKKVEAKVPPARKKYNGKQVECVVCLEEYVDGQSRVMSLPCGHEFHVECM